MKTQDIDKRRSYINFSIGDEHFAIIVSRVLEILHLDQYTKVPNASDYIRGILNFRGSIVPIINLHKRFHFTQKDLESEMLIVVEISYQGNPVLMGLLVDEVMDVIEIEYKDIRSVPEIGIKYNPEFVEGFIEKDGKFIMVLDVDRVLSVMELAELQEATASELPDNDMEI